MLLGSPKWQNVPGFKGLTKETHLSKNIWGLIFKLECCSSQHRKITLWDSLLFHGLMLYHEEGGWNKGNITARFL